MESSRPIVLLTGLGRSIGIAAGIAEQLARDGWDIAFVYNAEYDATLNGGAGDVKGIEESLRALGAQTLAINADLAEPEVATAVFDVAETLGPVSALVLSHAHSVNATLLTETIEGFDRHFAVNTRASWLLMRELARRFIGTSGRIVALTSDAIDGEIAYGASKGALDRLVRAAAAEFGPLGISANLLNPGPIDTGWMTQQIREWGIEQTPAGRLGTPADIAALVSFLLSERGGWISGQLLKADGGFSTYR
ncbi:SDR family oxidoreductase [Lacisediminihabitans changchengi]|uniref:SDR family oxidoreductase n=1 Tax=Lacisediminihabitans changchengi TaxID=2787634 RepID=A0A934SK41_9MICO|nr:SDR family oxidoreductase [Lacisediminihabitans changchengi]MBK4346780.1 SDR family oxidoreductase [Lacisediminihabitans changchengi]MBK4348097.1 SDR family oxidoreductase [Lacisediminihabitans changchengi]